MPGTAALGSGFQLYTEGSTEALGQAAAISGRTNLASLAWYNPSALAGTEQAKVMAGATFVSLNTDFESAISPALNSSMDDTWRTIPHFYLIQPLPGDWTSQLSINAPYGLITEWPENWAGSPLATYSELQTIYITPSASRRMTDRLALSAGFNAVYADAELASTTNIGVQVEKKLSGSDTGYGFTASAHYRLADGWMVGGRYQSRVKLKMDGEVAVGPVKTDGSVDLTLPSSINLGIAHTPTGKLSLGLDVVWTEWSTYNQLEVKTPAQTTVVPKGWNDVWSIRAGGEYALGQQWTVRAGYVWDESPVPNETRSPELPGADRQMVMAGMGWKRNNLGIDVAYAYLWAEKVEMGTGITDAAPGLAGRFDSSSRFISISASFTF
jgi:long-chain fatty acid transport protein